MANFLSPYKFRSYFTLAHFFYFHHHFYLYFFHSRSSRIPKPSPLLMESMLSAKLSQEISLPDTSPIKSLKKRAKGNDNNG